MTRIKEPDPNIDNPEVPDYKSPPNHIIKSLRNAYDNQRKKIIEKANSVQDLREKLRDTQQSRDTWKERMKLAEAEIEKLKKKNEELENSVKKKGSK